MAELVSVPLRPKLPDSGSDDSARSARKSTVGHEPPAGSGEGVDLREVYRVLRRRKGVVFGTIALVTGLTTLVVFQIVPRYTAESIVMVDTRKNQVADIQSVLAGLSSDSSAIRSEVEVLKSPMLAERVAKKLNLMNDLVFSPPVDAGAPLLVRWGVADWF